MLPLTRQEILKCYKPSEIFDTQEWQELDPNVTNKGTPVKVLIARKIKNIRILPRSVEVLISDSLETLDLDDYYDQISNLKVIICPKLKELNFVPSGVEQLIVNSCKRINFQYRYEYLIKLYADSLEHLEDISFPNLKYVSLNSLKKFEFSRSPQNLLWVSLRSLDKLDIAFIKSKAFNLNNLCKVTAGGKPLSKYYYGSILNPRLSFETIDIEKFSNMSTLYYAEMIKIVSGSYEPFICEINYNGLIIKYDLTVLFNIIQELEKS